MFLRTWNTLIHLALAAIITCGSVASASVMRNEQDGPPIRTPREWTGGPVTLPIGRQYHSAEILTAAFQLPQTQDLEALFFQRGYIRRLDLDSGGSSDSLSYALLGWEKPGVPVTDAAPAIHIISKIYYDPDLNTTVVATQAFGGLVRDSSGTLTTDMSGADAPVADVELVTADTPGAIVPDPGKLHGTQDMSAPYRFAYHEGPGGVGRMVKDGWAASCPFRRGLARASLAFAAGAAGTSAAISGSWWAAGMLAAAAVSADAWVNAKMTCQ